ncbi:MAG TPA: UDP-N-acetylmuramate--L-alanine ligase [Acidimicrobiales bacterium]
MPDPHPPPVGATDPGELPELGRPRVVHVVAIGGTGMSAIATVLSAMGHRVSGTDLRESEALDRLRALGVAVTVGHDAAHLPPDVDLVAISTAVPDDNPEVVEARRRGVLVVRRTSLLAAIAAERRTIAVAGTHGKTTTSALLALVLLEGGLDPSYVIGGRVVDLGQGAAWTGGDWFVVEADESDGSGFALPHAAAVVTNVEPDHLEYHGSVENLHAAFAAFLAATDGPRVVCADDEVALRLGREAGAITYGTSDGADLHMVEVRAGRDGVAFDLWRHGERLGPVHVPLPGLHNARNACAAIAVGLELGVSFDAAASAVGRFAGVDRRFQHRGEIDGVTFVDDYAHLPTEVTAAVAAARDGGWRRVVTVFQPHRYSRTEALWRDFADAFVGSDLLVLTDVYSAGEHPRPGVSGKLLVDAVLDAHGRQSVAYLPTLDDVVAYLSTRLRPGDLCLTLGAGDLTAVPDLVLARLRARGPAR